MREKNETEVRQRCERNSLFCQSKHSLLFLQEPSLEELSFFLAENDFGEKRERKRKNLRTFNPTVSPTNNHNNRFPSHINGSRLSSPHSPHISLNGPLFSFFFSSFSKNRNKTKLTRTNFFHPVFNSLSGFFFFPFFSFFFRFFCFSSRSSLLFSLLSFFSLLSPIFFLGSHSLEKTSRQLFLFLFLLHFPSSFLSSLSSLSFFVPLFGLFGVVFVFLLLLLLLRFLVFGISFSHLFV